MGKTMKVEAGKGLEKTIIITAGEAKQPSLFGKRDELMSAISVEMADLTERAEATAKRVEAGEKQQDELEGRLHNLRRILAELQKPYASAKG